MIMAHNTVMALAVIFIFGMAAQILTAGAQQEVSNGVATNPELKNSQKFSEILHRSRLSSKSSPKEKALPASSGYTQIAGLGYYKVHRDKAQWETARRRCAKEGGHLLVINSPVEAAAVVAASGLSGWNWLGFDDFTTNGEYITLHGTTLEEAGYVQWASGEPIDGLHCGAADVNGLLVTVTCKEEREFICELHDAGEYKQEERYPLLPVGYRAVGNLGYYRTHHDRTIWETARRRCEAEGAHLVVANTALEAAAVFRTSGLSSWFWAGFDDFDNYGNYTNFDGEQLGDDGVFSDFAPGDPDSSVHCGVGRDDAKLGTSYCKNEKEYICELYKPGEQPPKQSTATSPPAGYVALGGSGSYYSEHSDRAAWETARRRCQDEGAHLLIVNSQAEADAVLKGSGLPDWFWLGFDDYDFDGEYVYLDGTRVEDSGYVKWASSEPTEDVHCGVAKKDGLLGTGTCRSEREYICEWEKPSSPLPLPYPAGYQRIGDFGVYKVHRDRTPWETARRRCQAEGARLLVLNSADEAAAVLADSGQPDWFWVGFDDYDTSGEYITLDGTTLQEAGYDKWSPGEPDSDVNCGVAKVNGLLGTGTCILKREFICELI